MTVIIYTLDCPLTGEVRYVGKAKNLPKRFKGHLYDGRKNTHTANWIKSLRRKGLKPVLGVLEVIENSNDNDWQEAERFWISTLRFMGCKLCNLDSGGRGGKNISAETRLKLSIAHKGKLFSDTHLANLGAANRARILSADTIAKLSAQRKGKPRSLETRRKLSIAHTGKILSSEHKRKLATVWRGRKHRAETLEKMRKIAFLRHNKNQTQMELNA